MCALTPSPRQQQTIAAVTRLRGTGYWTGQRVTVEFRPASIDHGIVFVRRDLQPVKRIKAIAEHSVETPRRTTLTANGGTVEMVEHILAALSGLRIDNCEVCVDAAEMPACDGSSLEVTQALLDAGIVKQEALCHVLQVTRPIRVGDERAWIEASPCPTGQFTVRYELDYPDCPAIGNQVLETTVTPTSFRQELAAARTFVTEDEARRIQLSGLGANVGYQDILVFGEDGPVGNQLRFPNECVRHKVLDLVGDLAIAGAEIHAHVKAYRSGHRLNAQLVKALLADQALLRQSA